MSVLFNDDGSITLSNPKVLQSCQFCKVATYDPLLMRNHKKSTEHLAKEKLDPKAKPLTDAESLALVNKNKIINFSSTVPVAPPMKKAVQPRKAYVLQKTTGNHEIIGIFSSSPLAKKQMIDGTELKEITINK